MIKPVRLVDEARDETRGERADELDVVPPALAELEVVRG